MTISPETMTELASFGSATVYEAAGQMGGLAERLPPLDPTSVLVGPAHTVQCPPGDNASLHRAIVAASPGEILVADAHGYVGAGHWGEVMTVAAQARGIAGLIINGAVRDSQQIVRLGFPVFARGLSILAATKAAPPATGHQPIDIGNVHINPGDVIVADADGIAVVPSARLDEVVSAARRRMEREADMMAGLRAGRTTLEFFGLE